MSMVVANPGIILSYKKRGLLSLAFYTDKLT